MPAPLKTTSDGFAGASFPLMARIAFANGNNITQATTQSIAYEVRPIDNSEAAVQSTLTVANVVYDTLQTTGWDTDKDSTGYNFRWNVPGSLVPKPGKKYLILITFTATSGAGSHVAVLAHIRNTVRYESV